MAIAQQARMRPPTGSHVVTTSTLPVREAMEKSTKTWGIRALGIAAFAATIIPVIGLGVTYAIDHHKNSKIEANQKDVLANYYRNQIAAQLRMDPRAVNASHLALINPESALGKAVAKVTQNKNDANRAAALSTGAAAAATAFIPIPGAGTMAHTVSKLAVDATAGIAGGVVASAFNKDILHSQDVMEHLDAKLHAGQGITGTDIVMLKISQNQQLQEALKKQNGKAFHKMNEAQQRAVMVGMPDMRDAQEQADAVNNGKALQDVLMEVSAKPSWTQQVASSRGPQPRGTFVEQAAARRAAAVQGNSLNA